MPGHIREFNRIWRNNNTEATLRVLNYVSISLHRRRGGVREINYIYAIPCPSGPRYVPRSGSSLDSVTIC